MNQLPLTAIPPRPAATADAPSVFFVLRRYAWAIIGGAVLGTIVSGGLWYWLRKTSPYYAAEVTFQVLPPQMLLQDKSAASDVGMTTDEVASFIRRQALYLQGEEMLQTILQRDEFRRDYHDPNGTKPSRWLADHPDNPKKYLKQDMEIDQIPTAQVFRVRMMSKDNVEAARLVNAIADVYLDMLKRDTRMAEQQRLKELSNAVDNQRTSVERVERDLNNFREQANISAVTQRHTVEVQILAQLNADAIKMESEKVAAESAYNGLKDQANSASLPLTSEMQQYVENDPQLRNLIATRFALDQQRAVTIETSGTGSRALQEIDTRMATVNDQIRTLRDQLANQARQLMIETAETKYKVLAAQLQNMQQRRDEKDKWVADLDRRLVEYQQRTEELKSQQAILENLRGQLTLANLRTPLDDSRVSKFGGDAIPAEISDVAWPVHWKFIVPGALLGLLLSFGAAYLSELLNTRIRTPRDITKTMQLPMLGFVPDESDDDALAGDLATAVRTSPTSMIAESFRQIRARVLAQPDGQQLRTLLVASVGPGGGATTVANNLAMAVAMHETRVLLIDANFHRPGLRKIYKNLPAVGLSDVIADPSKLSAAIMESEDQPKLHVMSAGTRSPVGGSEVLETKAFRELLEQLKSQYDMVLFDGAPLSLVSDALTIGGRVDGVLAVVRAGEVSRGMVGRVRDQLRGVRANLLGIVLNAAQTHGAGYFKQNYRTFYKYAGQGNRAGASA